jgi:F-type H+-transporting ATPase subunit gamma
MAAGLKEVRERIKSVNSTQQITKAMKMVSAAKLRRAQQAITQMRPYADKQSAMLSNILSNLDGDGATSFGEQRDIQHATMVVVTSNRGLCGAFNTNVIKAAVAVINEKLDKQRQTGKLTIVCVGKKAFDYFRRRYTDCNVVSDYVTILAEDNSFDNVAKIPQRLMTEFQAKQTDIVYAAYGRFKNAGTQFAEAVQFLPVAKMEKTASVTPSKIRADYSFEPDKQTLLEALIPSILQTTFYKFTLDTTASEHGARMTAMDKATENANELIKSLRISYNKARQEAITKELSEIVGGVAALEG